MAHSAGPCGPPLAVVALGCLSFVNVTPWNTLSSMVTPSHMSLSEDTLQRAPISPNAWTSMNLRIRASSRTEQPQRFFEIRMEGPLVLAAELNVLGYGRRIRQLL